MTQIINVSEVYLAQGTTPVAVSNPAVTTLTEYTAVPYYSPQYACVTCRWRCCARCGESVAPPAEDACECTPFRRLNYGTPCFCRQNKFF